MSTRDDIMDDAAREAAWLAAGEPPCCDLCGDREGMIGHGDHPQHEIEYPIGAETRYGFYSQGGSDTLVDEQGDPVTLGAGFVDSYREWGLDVLVMYLCPGCTQDLEGAAAIFAFLRGIGA